MVTRILLILIVALTDLTEGIIEIKSLVVPERVQNGTEDRVILDCIYDFDPEEDKKLVVKWFKDDDPEPIYQWIPELNSRSTSEKLKDKINLDFAVNTANAYTKYRAINLVRPTTELSGRYLCHVASLRSQDYKEKSMLIYAPPKNISFDLMRSGSRHVDSRSAVNGSSKTQRHNLDGSSGGSHGQSATPDIKREMMALSDANELSVANGAATLRCLVEDVFPKPEIAIYRLSKDGRHPLLEVKRVEQPSQSGNRAHNIEISAQVVEADLTRKKYGDSTSSPNEPYTFECLMRLDINGGNITKSSRLTYFWATSSALSSISLMTTTHFASITSVLLVSTCYVRCLLFLLCRLCCVPRRWLYGID